MKVLAFFEVIMQNFTNIEDGKLFAKKASLDFWNMKKETWKKCHSKYWIEFMNMIKKYLKSDYRSNNCRSFFVLRGYKRKQLSIWWVTFIWLFFFGINRCIKKLTHAAININFGIKPCKQRFFKDNWSTHRLTFIWTGGLITKK